MQKLVFLDTETTGNNLLTDHLFQVCFSVDGKIQAEYFKPPVPISIKAQSITHVTNAMVEEKAEFKTSQTKEQLDQLLQENILVAHNAQFDIAMLTKEDVNVTKFICTLKLARFLDEDSIIPEYNLQFLRYYFELDVKADAHDAKSDVIVLEALFKKLYAQMLDIYKDEASVISKMLEISSQPFLFKLFSFGKYKGRKIEEISLLDKGYLEWLLGQKMQSGMEEEDWIFTLKYHLNK